MIITTFICFYIMYTYALKSSFLIYLQKMVAPAIFGVVLCIVLYFISLIPVTIPIVAMLIKGVVGVAFSIFISSSLDIMMSSLCCAKDW